MRINLSMLQSSSETQCAVRPCDAEFEAQNVSKSIVKSDTFDSLNFMAI
jgi:hypothetical protein